MHLLTCIFCSGLWANTYYCVGIPGTPLPSTPVTAPPPTTTTTTTTPPAGPSPTQDGIVANCQRYHLAGSGDSCQKIVDQYGTFTLAQFYAWNPAVGSSCSGLWLGYYYCVGDTCNPAAPTPTQPTPTCGCKRWHQVGSGNTCDSIQRQYGISQANFNKWNPGVGSDCRTLWLGYFVCVGV